MLRSSALEVSACEEEALCEYGLAAVAGGTLLENLTEWWDLADPDDLTGNHASNVLSKQGTPTLVSGDLPGGDCVEASTGNYWVKTGWSVGQTFTIAVWAKFPPTAGGAPWDASLSNLMPLENGANLDVRVNGVVAHAFTEPASGWHSLVVTGDGTGTEVFVDGVSQGTDATPLTALSNVVLGLGSITSSTGWGRIGRWGQWAARFDASKAAEYHNGGTALLYSQL